MSAIAIRWRGGAIAFASAHGDVVRVAPADGEACWQPEELLAAAAAAAYVLAVVDEAAQRDLPLVDGTVHAEYDGGRIRVDAAFETLPAFEAVVREAAEARATSALGVPLDVRLRAHSAEATATRRTLTSLV